MLYSTIQQITEHYNILHNITGNFNSLEVHYNILQYITPHHNTLHNITVNYNTLHHHSTLQYIQ